MNRNDKDPPPAARDAAAAPDVAPATGGTGDPPGTQASHRGSDPPKQTGQPAARHAGDGDGAGTGDGGDAAGPSAPSEIDRSTDA